METLIIFLIIFVPFGWVMWRLLRFTKNTIGTNSPMKVKRIYHMKARPYFLKFDNFFAFFCIVFALLMFWSITRARMAPDITYPVLARTSLLLGMAALAGLGVTVFLVDLNHWKYVGGVVLETFPEEHELEITFPNTKLRLKEGDIVRVLITSNEAKMRISFMTYYLANGAHFILSDKMPGVWVIHEYFKKIPVEYKHKVFPFIS